MEKKRRITRESTKNLVVKTGSGAKRIATAPGRNVKRRMNNLNQRMVAVEWTPRTMINEYVRFNITGTFNSIFAYLIYELFYWINLTDAYRSQAAWAACILIGQVECHYAHYRFTFGSAASYLTSLRWAVIIYTTILVLSTITFHLMVTEMAIYHRYAWVINIVLFGFVNFAFLRWLAFPPESDRSNVDSTEEE